MGGVSPSLLHRPPSSEDSSVPELPSNKTPRKRRRPNDRLPKEASAAHPEVTPDERRADKLQRNRLAAQSSRDRAKQEIQRLRDRVTELEEERDRLIFASGSPDGRPSEAWKEELQRENKELRERISLLEGAWDALQQIVGMTGAENHTMAGDIVSGPSGSSPAPSGPDRQSSVDSHQEEVDIDSWLESSP